MNNTATKLNSIENISAVLSQTLDESVFFNELSNFLAQYVECEHVSVFHSSNEDNHSALCAYVEKSQRPYFSNDVESDPVASLEAKNGVKSVLCLPIAHEGVVIAVMHFEMKSKAGNYSRKDVTTLKSIVSELKAPIANLKMYLSAMALNQALMKQINAKQNVQEVAVASTKIAEKEIVARSESMIKMLNLADKAASTNVNILIEGEFGTGKEMIARRVHCRSARNENVYNVVDCAQSEESFLNEVFGKGEVEGVLESSNGGTVLFKNVEKLSETAQSRLAQFAKDGIAVRNENTVSFRSNVRIIATSNKNLSDAVANGEFLDSLFYALNTIELEVPALRDRKEDIEVLAYHFLNRGKDAAEEKSIAPSALRVLKEYMWHNNVRELQNVMERAFIVADGMIVDETHLPASVFEKAEVEEVEEEEAYKFQEMTLTDLEKTHICKTLEFLGGNKTKTAKALGITVKTLYNKLHTYGMIVEEA